MEHPEGGERVWEASVRSGLVSVPECGQPLEAATKGEPQLDRGELPAPLARCPSSAVTLSSARVRLATLRTSDGTHAARLDGERILVLRAPDLRALLAEGIDTGFGIGTHNRAHL